MSDLLDALEPRLGALDRSYTLVGHSLGAVVGFELVRRLAAAGSPLPRELVVVGSAAPHLPVGRPAYLLPREELIEWLVNLGGVSSEILAMPGLLDCMLPTLRADLTISGTYQFQDAPPVPIPIHVVIGIEDRSCPAGRAEQWRRHTDAGFRLSVIPGGHFPDPADLAAALCPIPTSPRR